MCQLKLRQNKIDAKIISKKMTSDQSQQFNQDQDASATKQNRDFICGVVEGFYGRPWTTEQRKDLFRK